MGTFEKGNEILYFSSVHTPLLNEVFKWTTRLAEGPLFLFIILVTVRLSYGKGLVLAMNAGFIFVVRYLLFSKSIPAPVTKPLSKVLLLSNLKTKLFFSFDQALPSPVVGRVRRRFPLVLLREEPTRRYCCPTCSS